MTGKKSGGTPLDGGAAPQKRPGYELSGGMVGRCALLTAVPGSAQTAVRGAAGDPPLPCQLCQVRRHLVHEQGSVFLTDFCHSDSQGFFKVRGKSCPNSTLLTR